MTLVEQLTSDIVAETDNYRARVGVWRSDTGHLKTRVIYYKRTKLPWPFTDRWDQISHHSKLKSSYNVDEATANARKTVHEYQQEYDEVAA